MHIIAAVAIAAAAAVDPNAADATNVSVEAARPVESTEGEPDEDEAIVVTGVKRAAGDVLGGVSVLDKGELTHDLKPSLGDTLADLPGVSSSSFGPSSSRPILRGEQGERVRVLVDGIGSLDLSSIDPDQAVPINPLTAERIEVLRGPGALLFGSSAIGGVVNVIDTRIPRAMPKDIAADIFLNYGTAANERSGNVGVDVPLGGHFVLHADGAYSKYDDLHIGGFVLSRRLREEALASPDPDIRALADLQGTLPNTEGRLDDVAGGLAYVDGNLNVGFSVSHHDARYGVPIRFSLDPDVEAEQSTIDAHQDRGDVRINVPLGGFFQLFEFRGGVSKYRHSEARADGIVGFRFFSDGGEFRADVVQTERGGWGGTTGVQYLAQNARVRGEEKDLPDSRNQNFGVFTLQSIQTGKVRFEAGARVEFARLHANADQQVAEIVDDFAGESGADFVIGSVPLQRNFTAWSGSLGANYEFIEDWRVGLSLSHSERAPSMDELFTFGPHGGSAQFLIGDPNLELEKSNGIELSVHRETGPVHLQGSLYYSRFSNFIFQALTGAVEDNLPVYEYRQGKADYYGFELESEVRFGKALGIDWGGELTTDAVRAKIRNFGNAPEIPPFRVLAGLSGTRGNLTGRIEAERTSAQREIAPNETPTPGYSLVNASLDWRPVAKNPDLTLSLTGNNLFDVNSRRHSSDLKDYAPLAGRDVRLSARVRF